MSKNKYLMDKRCPLKIEEHPSSHCPLAVIRLKAIRNAGRELTEEEEALLPGCPWAVYHQMSNYCFFKYAADFIEERNISEIEIAAACCISVDTVRKTEKRAINKIKESISGNIHSQTLKEIFDNSTLGKEEDTEHKIFYSNSKSKLS